MKSLRKTWKNKLFALALVISSVLLFAIGSEAIIAGIINIILSIPFWFAKNNVIKF